MSVRTTTTPIVMSSITPTSYTFLQIYGFHVHFFIFSSVIYGLSEHVLIYLNKYELI